MRTEFAAGLLEDPDTSRAETVIRACVHCGFCLATCPTYQLLGDELDSPRGRIYLIKNMLETEAVPTQEVVTHLDRCLSCLGCVTTCPSGVDYRRLIDHARVYVEGRYARPLGERLLRWILASVLPVPHRFRAALALGRLARPGRGLLRGIPALAPVLSMLELAGTRPIRRRTEAPAPAAPPRGRVLVLKGCAEQVLQPQIREAAVRLLSRAGYVTLPAPAEACCGALSHHLGREAEAMASARRNIDAWSVEMEKGPVTAIVQTASGCGSMVKDYGHLLRADPDYADRAAAVSALARDVSEILTGAGLSYGRAPALTAAYHPPCSLQHGQRIVREPRMLLEAAGFKVVLPEDAHLCCGSAGVYNILQPRIAQDLGALKTASLEALEADVIVTGNIGCAVQIGRRARRPVVHLVELLDWASGGPVPAALEGVGIPGV